MSASARVFGGAGESECALQRDGSNARGRSCAQKARLRRDEWRRAMRVRMAMRSRRLRERASVCYARRRAV